MMRTVGITVLLAVHLGLCHAGGQLVVNFRYASSEVSSYVTPENERKMVCYYSPTSYFSVYKVPSGICTHLLYAFGSITGGGSGPTPSQPNITTPTADIKSIWITLTALRIENPDLKVMLSLQKGFPQVVGPDELKMQQFAANAVAFLRHYSFDGVDMDWEFPSSSQKTAFTNFLKIMRTAIDKDAKSRGKPALLLSLALPNNPTTASAGYNLPAVASAVDFGTAMTYDFHVFSAGDFKTGYNSPLFTPPGESKYLSTSAMISYYLNEGGFLPATKLLLGVPTYGRSWTLANASSHGLHAPAVGKGKPSPYHHIVGVYTYADVCVALQQGATSVADPEAVAVYLYHNISWVAFDDITSVTKKARWALEEGLGGVGVWSMTLDDISGVCGQGSLPLLQALKKAILMPVEAKEPLP